MKAHYFGSKAKGYTLRVNDNASPRGGKVYRVTGKREARALAKRLKAAPYNF